VHGYPDLSLADATVLRATAGTVLYLALIALLSLGIATAVRDVATAIGTVLSLLYLFPVLGLAVTCPGRHRHRQQIAPMAAGLEIQASTGLSHLPISPWADLGVLAAAAAWPAASCSGSATREPEADDRRTALKLDEKSAAGNGTGGTATRHPRPGRAERPARAARACASRAVR
jgi:hypothetical protein